MTAVLPSAEPLVGTCVRLDPLTGDDVDELAALLADPRLYAEGYVMHRRPSSPGDGRALVGERFAPGSRDPRDRLPFAVRLVADGRLGPAGTLVGTSSLLDAVPAHDRIHLGSTLYGSRWWGTAVNAETKLLLLGRCFDAGFGRVKIQTDALNTRSQAAIAKLGAQREGVLRRHTRREDGTFRDTVVFSVLADEWPAVRAGLERRLAPAG